MKWVHVCLIGLMFVGCSRQGEYIYFSDFRALEPVDTLIPKIRGRLVESTFRKNYDPNTVEQIGSSFRSFKQIRAYQEVLEDALVYILLKSGKNILSTDLRNTLKSVLSTLILSDRSGPELIPELEAMAQLLADHKTDAARLEAIGTYAGGL